MRFGMDAIDVAIILPAYNEEQTIEKVLEGFHASWPAARIYVINNNSADNTAALAESYIKDRKINGHVLHETRQGKGNAMRRAFMEIDADIYVMVDADLTYPPEILRQLIAPVADGRADMVVGDRHSEGDYAKENDRPLHDFGNKLVQKLVNYISSSTVTDIMSGYRVMSKTFVKSYPILVEGFQIETDMTIFALQNRFRIVEIPIRYSNRPAGSHSKLDTYRDGFKVIKAIFNLFRYYRPLQFFSNLSVLISFIGLLCGAPVILEYFRTGIIHRIPLAILATGLETIAIITFGVGLMLDSVAYHRRLDNENVIKLNTPPRYPKEYPFNDIS